MALCLLIEQGFANGKPVTSTSGYQWIPFSASQATFNAGQYACPTGSHLVLTTAEINQSPTNIPDAELMRESFFMSFGLILGCYVLGKFVGSVLDLIKGNKHGY